MWRISVLVALAFTAAWLMAPGGAIGGDKATPSSKTIIDKAITFHGGAKALGRELSLIRTEESEMVVEGEKIGLQCDWEFQPPDKRLLQSMVKIGALQLHVRMGIVGDKGWTKIGQAVADLSPEQLSGLSWEHDNHLRNVQMLASAERTHDIGEPQPARIGDRDAWQITFTDKKDKKRWVTAFFDKTTGQVLGDETERVVATLNVVSAREKPSKFRVIFHDFLDVDGMKMPDKLTILRDGTPIVEVRKSQVRVVTAIDPKSFLKPN